MVRNDQKEATRKRILHAALAEFVEKGFHGASTRSICTKAGISSGLLFHYFESKEALYQTLVESAFSSMMSKGSPEDPLSWLTQTADAIFDLASGGGESALIFAFMSEAERRRGISPEIDRLFDERAAIQGSVDIFRRGQEQGLIRAGDPAALSLAWWAAVLGVAEDLAMHPNAPRPVTDWLLDIVRKRGES